MAFWAALGGAALAKGADVLSNRWTGAEQVNRQADLQERLDTSRPSWQMQGFRAAGLNPMLAFSKLDFGTAPMATGMSSNMAQDFSSIYSAQNNAETQEAQRENIRAGTEMIREQTMQVIHQTRKAAADAGMAEIDVKKAEALVRAMAKSAGNKDWDSSESLEDFYKKTIGDPAVAQALSDIEMAKNDAAFYRLFNAKELSVAGSVLSGIWAAYSGSKPRSTITINK